MENNYGLNLELEKEQQKPTDWLFGSTSVDCIAQIPLEERDKFLPVGEVQVGKEDMKDCASRAPINILETKFNYLIRKKLLSEANLKWLHDNGYSIDGNVQLADAFVAINSGTTRNGNSLIAPLEAIRKNGLVPKFFLPLKPSMTWEDYHNPVRITSGIRRLGKEFLKRFDINYERVMSNQFEELLNKELVNTAGYAWFGPDENGEFLATKNTPNHAFMIYDLPAYFAFDNYIDPVDGDFIKKLKSDYNFLNYGYRVIIKAKEYTPSFWSKLIDWLSSLI